ncbi:hypothetical protein [Halomonas sp. I5-271120]|uniref:hypothetical protein n=1 Tax=Halomonas sp. I5-271120 TaxID=3061632 RepID=UPI002714EED0|nr:hypothetical protein [Halomonas sp. I5-271120]
MRYIINPHGHYFHVADAVTMENAPFPECRHFDDEKTMLETVAREHLLDMDEIEGSTFEVFHDEAEGLVCADMRGCTEPLGASLQDYITHYAL